MFDAQAKEKLKESICSEAPGWWKVLGNDLIAEMDEILSRTDSEFQENFEIFQAKEKYGRLRIYGSPYNEELEDLFSEYSVMSKYICPVCGKKATWTTTGWIGHYCDEHVPEGRNKVHGV